jgi:hypothetical protein
MSIGCINVVQGGEIPPAENFLVEDIVGARHGELDFVERSLCGGHFGTLAYRCWEDEGYVVPQLSFRAIKDANVTVFEKWRSG